MCMHTDACVCCVYLGSGKLIFFIGCHGNISARICQESGICIWCAAVRHRKSCNTFLFVHTSFIFFIPLPYSSHCHLFPFLSAVHHASSMQTIWFLSATCVVFLTIYLFTVYLVLWFLICCYFIFIGFSDLFLISLGTLV